MADAEATSDSARALATGRAGDLVLSEDDSGLTSILQWGGLPQSPLHR